MSKIRVVPYDHNWPVEFEKIKNAIWASIVDIALVIEHVGSTSVAGLAAKPVMDLDIVVKRDILPEVILRLGCLGYVHEGDLGVPDREAFKYESKPDLMRHHLYVCPEDSMEYQRHIAFRNYLRAHPADCERYSRLKIMLAQKFPQDINQYIKGKEAFILEVYANCGFTVA